MADDICACEWAIYPPSMRKDKSNRTISKYSKSPEFSVALCSSFSHNILEIRAFYDGNCKYAAIGIAVSHIMVAGPFLYQFMHV